jgi:hypothetical protein
MSRPLRCAFGFPRAAHQVCEETTMKYFMILLLLGGVAMVNIGCEADAEIDDDGAELKIDED